MQNIQNIIEVKNLITGYGGNIIHNQISFEVHKGDIFAILGGSGSGKSTLLNTMIFLKKPLEGEVRILGKDIWRLDFQETLEMKLKFGVLFQFGALFSSLNVLDNLLLPLRESSNFNSNESENIAYFLLTRVGLDSKVAKLYPSELSGGMVKRVGLARALCLSPKILFLDEPTSGLDPKGARHFDELIKELRDLLGISIVMVTHDMDSVKGVVDRMIVLRDRQIFFQGSLEELSQITDYLDLFLYQI